jgi:hypothetical protein
LRSGDFHSGPSGSFGDLGWVSIGRSAGPGQKIAIFERASIISAFDGFVFFFFPFFDFVFSTCFLLSIETLSQVARPFLGRRQKDLGINRTDRIFGGVSFFDLGSKRHSEG